MELVQVLYLEDLKMNDEEIFLQKRFAELADKSYKCNQYFFTDFLQKKSEQDNLVPI